MKNDEINPWFKTKNWNSLHFHLKSLSVGLSGSGRRRINQSAADGGMSCPLPNADGAQVSLELFPLNSIQRFMSRYYDFDGVLFHINN